MTFKATIDAGVLHRAAGANPIVPTSWDFTTLLLGGTLIALVALAIISLSRDRHYTPAQRLLWLLVILAAPVVGPILWFAVGRRHALEHQEG
ncbi:PLD nuclease N-terminal domain-containing protein [Kocuria sp. CPCC 205258]|uniref:PLD nuclease N-terminal domain-containing protein n=1 Tax=Kocuria sp. CPCC 205258 TaxID=3073552 RepID=UPI0034D420CF